jgi:hypothetical protein
MPAYISLRERLTCLGASFSNSSFTPGSCLAAPKYLQQELEVWLVRGAAAAAAAEVALR